MEDGYSSSLIQLHQNFPNPFQTSTNISFTVPFPQHIELTVYNSAGQVVKSLLNQYKSTGIHNVAFDPEGLPPGYYLYVLKSKDLILTKRMIIDG